VQVNENTRKLSDQFDLDKKRSPAPLGGWVGAGHVRGDFVEVQEAVLNRHFLLD